MKSSFVANSHGAREGEGKSSLFQDLGFPG
jgi:hypothetical protein